MAHQSNIMWSCRVKKLYLILVVLLTGRESVRSEVVSITEWESTNVSLTILCVDTDPSCGTHYFPSVG